MKNELNKKHIGSDFNDFLYKNGLLEECLIEAEKEVISYQINAAMKERKITKTELSKSMKTSRSSLDRLLDPKSDAVTLKTLKKAAKFLGKKLIIKFE